jgi:putative mycofactocin binding protein MftB
VAAATVAFDPDAGWRLHPQVALRPEPFGALAYHYGNRRLNFLRSADLVAVVEVLDRHPSARAAYDACGVEPRRWPAFERALAALAASEFVVPQAIEERPAVSSSREPGRVRSEPAAQMLTGERHSRRLDRPGGGPVRDPAPGGRP